MKFLTLEDILLKIHKAIAENATSLELDFVEYHLVLPDFLAKIPNLRRLRIRNSRITVPEWICDIKTLKTLELEYDVNVSRILPHMHKLKNLCELKLAKVSGFMEFPVGISKLRHLKSLNIDGADIERLPEEFAALESLENFSFIGCTCKMDNVFGLLAKLPNLKTLLFRYDNFLEDDEIPESQAEWEAKRGFDTLPKSFTSMQRLEEFTFDEWQRLASLPTEIGKMQSLKVIDIGNRDFLAYESAISELPDSIGELENLETLNIHGCAKITKLPDSIKNLRKLKAIDFIGSGIDKLSLTDRQWRNLEYLRAQGEMPNFAKCPNLKTFAWVQDFLLGFSRSGILEGSMEVFDLPINCLHKLENLNIYGGRLLNLNFLDDMPNLKKLILCCNFSYLPDCLGDMKYLEEICIYNAPSLKALPESLSKSKSLKYIGITNSGISKISDIFNGTNIKIDISLPCRDR